MTAEEEDLLLLSQMSLLGQLIAFRGQKIRAIRIDCRFKCVNGKCSEHCNIEDRHVRSV